MTEQIITRRAPLRATSWNAETRTFDFDASTGAPVERWDARGPYLESLLVSGARFCTPLPLLNEHRRDSVADQIGQVGTLKVVGGKLTGQATLSRNNSTAQLIGAELSDGQTYSISIGYRVLKWSERTNAETQKREKIATEFEVLEVSLVTLPADRQAGIRSMTTETTQAATPETSPPAAVERAAADTLTRSAINAEIRSIARIANLAQAWIDGQVDAEATLDQARAAALAEMQRRSQATTGIRSTIQVGEDHGDPVAIRSAMADALAHRLAPGVVKLEGRGVTFRSASILDMVGAMAEAGGERVNLRDRDALLQRAVGAHSTSDFPLLLADAANKALLAQYQVAAPTYRKWAARKPFVDFKEHSFLRVGDFPAFKEIYEGGEVKYGSISEAAEKVRAKEYGTGIAIGRRALINDDLSALSDFSSTIALRAAADENRLAYDVLKTNAALSDGKALFHADHGNLAAAGATLANGVAEAVGGLRAQKSLDGLALNLQPAFLVVGPKSEVAARQVLATVIAAKAADVNVWAGFAELIVDAEITDSRWYLFASPSAAPVVVFGYVGGAEGPQVRTERDFDTQAVKVAAGLDFAVGAVDFRGAFLNAGS